MTKLQKHRRKAVEILLAKADKTIPMLIDYQLDAALRNLLNLPKLPPGGEPYSGWMVGGGHSNNSSMIISSKGLNLIKHWEGYRSNAYKCPAGVWTIGYGHTKGVYEGQKITSYEADIMLKEDLAVFEGAVSRFVKVNLTQGQFDALVSFAFNVGVSAFQNSTLLRLLNKGDYDGAAGQFQRWVKAGKQTLPGLVRRRESERKVFLS